MKLVFLYLNSWSIVIFENLVDIRFVKKFSVFYGSRSLLPWVLEPAIERFRDRYVHFTYSRFIPLSIVCECVHTNILV
jgi:hypothetical protein